MIEVIYSNEKHLVKKKPDKHVVDEDNLSDAFKKVIFSCHLEFDTVTVNSSRITSHACCLLVLLLFNLSLRYKY